MEPLFELAIRLPPRGSRDLLGALHRQLRTAIVNGRLQPGLKLPPTRALAAACGVSRNTAVAAYDLLLSEGYLVARRGSGTYVARVLPQAPQRRTPAGNPAVDRRLNAFWRKPPLRESLETGPRPLDFRLGIPDRASFPFDIWRRLSARALRALTKQQARDFADPRGQPALREAVARHISFARAVACRAEDILVTAGAQQAFDLLARVLVTPQRTVVAVENPGYPLMRAAFAAAGARIVPVPVDREGLVVERLPAEARVICVTPSHQFPLGAALSASRRAALLEFAQARGAVVIEDDYDGEFRFGGRPLDALQTLDRAECVFYVGTFSKSLFQEIRLGYVVAPPWAQRALLAAKLCADRHCDVQTQETLAAFIGEGYLARHVRKMRTIYGERREALLQGLRDFDRWLEPVASVAGLHLAALAKASVDADALARRAGEQGVGVRSLRSFYIGRPASSGLVFGYGVIEKRAIGEALSRMRRSWRT